MLLSVALVCVSLQAQTAADSDFLHDLGKGDKAAVLIVSFGTSHDDARAVTVDALFRTVAEEFPQMDVREACTSRMIRRILQKRGIEKDTPHTALLKLAAEGYTHVAIQCSNLLDGEEVEALREEVQVMRPFFKEIRMGTPLLHSVEDCRQVISVLTSRLQSLNTPKTHFVWVGHGSPSTANAVYSQLDYMLKAEGHPNFHVATIEGYPTAETVLAKLKEAKAKKVILVPLVFVAGDHAKNDIGVNWREMFAGEGFQVDVIMEGLGEIPEIRTLYLDHLHRAMGPRNPSLSERKKAYEQETE